MAQVQIKKKITAKDVISGFKGEGYGLIAGKEKAHDLFTILGRITSAEVRQTDKGPYVHFKGTFQAVRTPDGAVFKSPGLILPGVCEDVMQQAWIESLPKNEDGTLNPLAAMPMAFAFVVGVEPHSGISGYQYTMTPIDIGDDADTDPLADIIKAVAKSNPAALPAPKTDEKKGGK